MISGSDHREISSAGNDADDLGCKHTGGVSPVLFPESADFDYNDNKKEQGRRI
jgi:hypothetical protein